MSKIEKPALIWCRRPNPSRKVVSAEQQLILVINIVVPLVLIMCGTGTPYHYRLFISIAVCHVTSPGA